MLIIFSVLFLIYGISIFYFFFFILSLFFYIIFTFFLIYMFLYFGLFSFIFSIKFIIIFTFFNLYFISSTVILDRKSTRLNSSHANISYAVFCLKKKNSS